jgi:hypothetical protein
MYSSVNGMPCTLWCVGAFVSACFCVYGVLGCCMLS